VCIMDKQQVKVLVKHDSPDDPGESLSRRSHEVDMLSLSDGYRTIYRVPSGKFFPRPGDHEGVHPLARRHPFVHGEIAIANKNNSKEVEQDYSGKEYN
jgi:hypothetical protein